MKLILATKNKGKAKEIREFFKGMNIELLSLNDFPEIEDIPETGDTFEENAWIKAKAVYDNLQVCTLADDSGLEVDYLNGRPGVYSARYAGENASDEDNRKKLLHELKHVAEHNRSARFICVMVLYDGIRKNIFKGVCEGKIIEYGRGNDGFGYDPLFVPAEQKNGYGKTFAELGMDIKNKISHRGKALEMLREQLASALSEGEDTE